MKLVQFAVLSTLLYVYDEVIVATYQSREREGAREKEGGGREGEKEREGGRGEEKVGGKERREGERARVRRRVRVRAGAITESESGEWRVESGE